METKTKSKAEIVLETAAAYIFSTRSSTLNDVCRYLGPMGRRCAFSRCCIDSPEVNEKLRSNENNDACTVLSNCGEDILKPEYRGHTPGFWMGVQEMHDTSHFWDENGLTEYGEEYKQTLLSRYREN